MNLDQALQLSGYMYLQERYAEAEAVLLSAISNSAALTGVQDSRAFLNLAILYSVQGRFDECTKACEKALALDPQFYAAADLLGHQRLRDGDWISGFELFEARFAKPQGIPRLLSQYPLWDGRSADKPGQTVLVWFEQGLGDTVQFSRFIYGVRARGFRVVFLVQDELVDLMVESKIADEILPMSQSIEVGHAKDGSPLMTMKLGVLESREISFHIPVMSLARVLKITPENVGQDSGISKKFLSISAEREESFRNILTNKFDDRLRVGLVWSGSSSAHVEFQKTSNRRRLPLHQLRSVIEDKRFQFVSLQKGFDALAGLEFDQIMKPELTNSFADTAAILKNLDVLLTVDTSIAHVAGGLGVPVMLMDRFDSCWRWLRDRKDSVWYDKFQIARQHSPGDWQSVVDQVQSLLVHFRK